MELQGWLVTKRRPLMVHMLGILPFETNHTHNEECDKLISIICLNAV